MRSRLRVGVGRRGVCTVDFEVGRGDSVRSSSEVDRHCSSYLRDVDSVAFLVMRCRNKEFVDRGHRVVHAWFCAPNCYWDNIIVLLSAQTNEDVGCSGNW